MELFPGTTYNYLMIVKYCIDYLASNPKYHLPYDNLLQFYAYRKKEGMRFCLNKSFKYDLILEIRRDHGLLASLDSANP